MKETKTAKFSSIPSSSEVWCHGPQVLRDQDVGEEETQLGEHGHRAQEPGRHPRTLAEVDHAMTREDAVN